MTDQKTTGRFVWHDLNTNDSNDARSFYGELFSWTFEASDNSSYHHVKANNRLIGGIRGKEDGEPGPPSWLGYVLVESVGDTVERDRGGGAEVLLRQLQLDPASV